MWQDKIQQTHRDIKKAISLGPKNRFAIAYSGGKDAIVLAHILTQYGIKLAYIDTSMYFTKQAEDAQRYALEQGLTPVNVCTLTWEHLQKNSEMYFPQQKKNKYLGIAQRQWKSIRQGIKMTGADIVFYGRRIGENKIKGVIEIRPDIIKVCPIRHWTTEEVWQYMMDHQLRIPWIYRTMFAQYLNNAPWHTLIGSKLWAWDIVANTEEAILEQACSHGLPSAIQYKSYRQSGIKVFENNFEKSWFAKPSSTLNPYKFMGQRMPMDPADGVNYYRND